MQLPFLPWQFAAAAAAEGGGDAPPPKPPATTQSAPNGNRPYKLSQSVVNAVAVVVTVVWGISFVADILIPAYTPPTNVHMALMVVLGGVFGSQFIRKE